MVIDEVNSVFENQNHASLIEAKFLRETFGGFAEGSDSPGLGGGFDGFVVFCLGPRYLACFFLGGMV